MSEPTSPVPVSPITSLPPFSTTSASRLQALYSDFSRQKHSNPASYHANVEWWRKALESLVGTGSQNDDSSSKHDRFVLHANRELVNRVKIPKVGKPLSLGAVLSECRATKSFLQLSEFMNAKVSIYDPGWLPARIAAYVVGKPLWWALEQMGVVGDEGLLSSNTDSSPRRHGHDTSWYGDYVLVSLVESAADKVAEMQRDKMATRGDALYTLYSFRETFSRAVDGEEPLLRELDAKVLLRYLERDLCVVVVDQEVIKFVEKTAPAQERVVTPVDRGILEVKSALQNLHKQIDGLQTQIDECTKKATVALEAKRKTLALSYLRSRKKFEDTLMKRLGSLNTLEGTYNAIETAAGDLDIMKSYESSTTTLRMILDHPSLQRSKIDETLEALAEANTEANEINETIRIGGDVAVGVNEAIDDDELEAELKAMIKEEETLAADKVQAQLRQAGATPVSIEGSKTSEKRVLEAAV